MPTGYANFHLLITRSHDRYNARVTTSPVGQATIDFALPFSQEGVRRLSWRMGFSPRHLALVTSPTSAPELSLEEFGTRLFDAVFAGDVGKLFFRSLDEAKRSQQPLRIRLQFDDVPEVAELPWEYLYSDDLGRFLLLSTQTPLVRYMALAQPERSLAVPLPLHILVIVSDPDDLPRLDVEQEWARLNEAVGALARQGKIVLERLEGATLSALRQSLRRQHANILHFIGHGSFAPEQDEGSLAFENEAGQHHSVTSEQLATHLHDHEPLRLVFLNACQGASSGSEDSFAGVAQKLVQQGVPTVLAMQFPVSDRAAITLAHEFYQALTDGLPIESAVSEARKAIYSEGDALEWGTPVLFSRSPDGVILALNEGSEEAMENPVAKPWWEQLGNENKGLQELRSLEASGDVIIGVVGAGARNVAVGKNITQQIYEIVGTPTPDDKQVITEKFAQVDAALAAQQSAIDGAKMQMAAGYLELLRGELTKTGEDERASASTITLVGNWLLDNVPQIIEALTSLFATPAVGRVIGKAGEAAATWVKTRFAQ